MQTEKLQINFRMIEIARISRGFNQKDLAEKVGIEQGTISKLETGLLSANKEILDKLCHVLNYPPSFFADNINVLSPLITHYRKRKSIANQKLDFIEYNIYIRKHIIKKLLKSADIPYKLFHLDPQDYDPEDIARIVRQKWKVPRGPIENLVKLVENAGVIILQIEHNDDKLDGEMIPDESNLPLIYVNKNLSGDRQRFTIAHELGHLIMHSGETIPDLRMSEIEANNFASEFLMPSDDIRFQLNERLSIAQLGNLKRYWKVSMAALVRRAKDLNIIDDSRYKSLNVQLSKAGFKKKEPDFDVFPEKPSIVKQLFSVHFNELGYTYKELSDVLCLNEQELKSVKSFYSDNLFALN